MDISGDSDLKNDSSGSGSEEEFEDQKPDILLQFKNDIQDKWNNSNKIQRMKYSAQQQKIKKNEEAKQQKSADDNLIRSIEEEESKDEKVDHVRESNFCYGKIQINDWISSSMYIFALMCYLMASLLGYKSVDDPQTDSREIRLLYDIGNIVYLFSALNDFLNIVLHVQWMQKKALFSHYDDIFNSGLMKSYLTNQALLIIQPSSFLIGYTYQDNLNEFTKDIKFAFNDVLLAICIFIRGALVLKLCLSYTYYTDPRAQRACQIFGCDASFIFGLKCLMKETPFTVVATSFFITLFQLSFMLMLFERYVDTNFESIYTCIWNVIITLTTVGYGDFYPKTNCGRLVGILTAFWGVFFVSLFVVALTNILEFDTPERKAYTLLKRLEDKQNLKKYAARVLACHYKFNKIEKENKDNKDYNQKKDNKQLLRSIKVEKKKNIKDFRKLNRQLLNMNDYDAMLETMKVGVEYLVDDVTLIRQSQYYVYNDVNMLKDELKKAKRNLSIYDRVRRRR